MTWTDVAAATDLPEGGALRVEVDGVGVALFRHDGEVLAIDDLCSHDEASLAEGEVDDGCVACPHHGARFDLRTGAALTLPAVEAVGSWRARESGGRIEIGR